VGREGGEPPTFITKFTPMRRPLGLLIGIPNRRLEWPWTAQWPHYRVIASKMTISAAAVKCCYCLNFRLVVCYLL